MSPDASTVTGTGGGFVTTAPSECNDYSCPQNYPPIAEIDYMSGGLGTPFAPDSVPMDVLSNDYDPEGDTLTVTSFTQPSHGTVTDGGGGVLIYTTNEVQDPADFQPYIGPDFFTYTIGDGRGNQAQGMVQLIVTKVKVNLEFRNNSTSTITPDPENSCYPTAKLNSGTDKLGPLPVGTGREDPEFKGKSYVNQYEVVGTVNPDGAKSLQYRWDVRLSFRSWFVQSDTTKWTVTQRSRGGLPPGPPVNDAPIAENNDAIPDPTSGKIFMVDPSGVNLSGQPVGVGDFVRVEKQFVYRVFVTQGGSTKKAGERTGLPGL